MWKRLGETIQNIRQNFWKSKELILPESTDNTTLVDQMANFFMNKIHKINDALETCNKFKPVERDMDNIVESFKELGIEEIKKLIKTKLTICSNDPILSKFIIET